MTLLHTRQRSRQERMARFCAYTVLASAIFTACRDERKGTPPQGSQDTEGAEIPHFIPPKERAPVSISDSGIDSGIGRNAKDVGEGGGGGYVPSEPDVPGCPANMGRTGSICMDRFEVTLLDKKSGFIHPYYQRPPYDMNNLVAISDPGVFPQGYLSQEMLAKACENAGKRLCTHSEWQAACTGAGKRKFPYGNEPVTGTCNVDKRDPHILDKYFPDTPHLKRTGKHFNDPALLQDPDYLGRTGTMRDCRSPEGIFDLDGNLSEWVSDTVSKPDGLHGTFAGDAFSGAGKEGCGRKTSAHASSYHDYSMGGRCCTEAKR
ncbi:MAG: SUMF1/EgtB/PvdO family nonheme iron enzyme [Candidatus Micrarchaeota archaeon]